VKLPPSPPLPSHGKQEFERESWEVDQERAGRRQGEKERERQKERRRQWECIAKQAETAVTGGIHDWNRRKVTSGPRSRYPRRRCGSASPGRYPTRKSRSPHPQATLGRAHSRREANQRQLAKSVATPAIIAIAVNGHISTLTTPPPLPHVCHPKSNEELC
jgi:hypothetical protein